MDVWIIDDVMPTWAFQSAKYVAERAHRIDREGGGPGSLTDDGLHYSMADGEELLDVAPELDAWITRVVAAHASAVTGEALRVSPDVPSAINVNVLSGMGERYELHTDPCPFSGVLFVTGHHDGGQWYAKPLDGVRLMVEPVAGRLVVFRGSIPHAVEPLADDSTRISIPVALYPAHVESVDRDPALNAHIGL